MTVNALILLLDIYRGLGPDHIKLHPDGLTQLDYLIKEGLIDNDNNVTSKGEVLVKAVKSIKLKMVWEVVYATDSSLEND